MDPVSLTLGIAGILGSVIHGCNRLRELVKTIRHAPREVVAVKEDTDELSRILLLLCDFYQQGKVPDTLAGPLMESLENCNKRIEKTETYFKGFIRTTSDIKVNRWSKVSWTLNKSDVKELQAQLQQHKTNLNIFVSIFNATQADRNHGLLSQQISKLEKDMTKRDSDKVDLGSVVGDQGSMGATTDVHFAMQRFLDDLPATDQEWVAGSEVPLDYTDTIGAYEEEEEDDETVSADSLPTFHSINFPADYHLSDFHRAVVFDRQDVVTGLLAGGADVNERSARNLTALHFAADLANTGMARLLLKNGADVEATNKRGRPALRFAVLASSQDVACILIDAGADLNSAWDLLSGYADCDNVDPKKKLLRAIVGHANFKAKADGQALEILHDAVRARQTTLVQLLLQEGFDSNLMNKDGLLPIHYAASVHGLSEVELLLEHGADIDATTSPDCRVHPDSGGLGCTSLHIAAITGDVEMLQLLVDRGANADYRDLSGGNALQALGVHSPACARILLDAGAQINNYKRDGQTPLYWAVICNNAAMISFLLSRGATLRSPSSGETALLTVAAANGRYAALCALLDAGADPNVWTLAGWTPLHGSVRRGELRLARRLVQAGAFSLTDHKGETPLALAERLGRTEMVDYLRAAKLPEKALGRDGLLLHLRN